MKYCNTNKLCVIFTLILLIENCLCLDFGSRFNSGLLNMPIKNIIIDELNYNKIPYNNQLNIISNSIKNIQTPECVKHLIHLLNGLSERRSWAVEMYDSTAKSSTGVEFGSVYQFGNFDECLNADAELKGVGLDFRPKYCLADIVIEKYTIRNLATRQPFNTINTTTIHWAVCMPSTCKTQDIIIFLRDATGYNNVTLESNQCTERQSFKYASIDIAYGSIVIGLVIMTVFCTVYHTCVGFADAKNSDSCFKITLMSFSLIANLKKLVKASNDDMGLGAINGMKAVSMFFIISGHALLFMAGGPVLNSEFFAHEIKLFQNALFINSTLLVDTFLFLSGFLFARLLLLEIEKRHGRINLLALYMFRYIRLTPAYLMMIGMYSTWFDRLGSGPLWNARIGNERERCQSSWWLNLLYINNYFGTDNICMFQSWYLAADTQLFVLAPLIIYPMWRWKRVGFTLLTLLGIASIIIPFVLTYNNNWDPSFMAYTDEVIDISVNSFFVAGYIKTHMRMAGYLMGIFFGYLVHKIQEKRITIPAWVVASNWLLSTIIGVASISLLSTFFFREFSPIESAFYAAFHRVGWSLATAWIVLACVTNNAGPLKSILTSRALVPFSRLTYCAYLANGFVELYSAASVRAPKYMSVINMLFEASSHVWLTFLTAILICLIFESPIHGIEKIFFKKELENKQKSTGGSENTIQEDV